MVLLAESGQTHCNIIAFVLDDAGHKVLETGVWIAWAVITATEGVPNIPSRSAEAGCTRHPITG